MRHHHPLSLALLAGLLFAAAAGSAAAEPEAPPEEKPIGNDVFSEVTTTARITQHFEMYNPRSAAQLQSLKAMGFTQVILDWPTLHVDATKLGLNVVMANWWSLQTEVDTIQKSVDYAKQVDSDRLAGVSMMDEPERYARDTPFSFYRSLYEGLRAHFDEELPGVKLEISHWGPLVSWTQRYYDAFIPLYQATDRIRLMPYPDLNEGPLSDVYYQMIRSRHLMQLAGRELPQVVILQTWVLPEKPDLPTIEELRVMAYLAMLAGADTLSFYSYDPAVWEKTPGFEQEFAELMAELTALSQQYRDAVIEARMDVNGVMAATASWPNGRSTLIHINSNRQSVDDLGPLEIVIRSNDDGGAPAMSSGCVFHPGCRQPVRRARFRWRRFCNRFNR